MCIRLFSVFLVFAASIGLAADPPTAKSADGKGSMEQWAELNAKYRAISHQLMTRRSAIVKESEDAKVIQAQIRDLTKKIQELQQDLAKIVAEDEEYKKLQTQMTETRTKLHNVQISRRAPTRHVPRTISAPNPATTQAVGPPPPPPPPPLPTPK